MTKEEFPSELRDYVFIDGALRSLIQWGDNVYNGPNKTARTPGTEIEMTPLSE